MLFDLSYGTLCGHEGSLYSWGVELFELLWRKQDVNRNNRANPFMACRFSSRNCCPRSFSNLILWIICRIRFIIINQNERQGMLVVCPYVHFWTRFKTRFGSGPDPWSNPSGIQGFSQARSGTKRNWARVNERTPWSEIQWWGLSLLLSVSVSFNQIQIFLFYLSVTQ